MQLWKVFEEFTLKLDLSDADPSSLLYQVLKE